MEYIIRELRKWLGEQQEMASGHLRDVQAEILVRPEQKTIEIYENNQTGYSHGENAFRLKGIFLIDEWKIKIEIIRDLSLVSYSIFEKLLQALLPEVMNEI